MAHLLQVGAGSGGMAVLDLLARDPRITQVTLIEPDVYKPHNVVRHLFPLSAVGQLKADVARQWLLDRRPDLDVRLLTCDLLEPTRQAEIDAAVRSADIGVCAADNETAKYHWDALFRRHGKPWTLGEVLSGGIGGFVHLFRPGGACYGCVASFLQRSPVEKPPPPDYTQPGGVAETTVPASIAAIHAIASLHALATLGLLDGPAYDPGFTSLLLSLQQVSEIFNEAFRPRKLRVPRVPECLICRETSEVPADQLDAALDEALTRLHHA